MGHMSSLMPNHDQCQREHTALRMQLLDSIVMCTQGDDRYDMDEPNPFAQEEEPGDIASVAYRYVCACVFTFYGRPMQ